MPGPDAVSARKLKSISNEIVIKRREALQVIKRAGELRQLAAGPLIQGAKNVKPSGYSEGTFEGSLRGKKVVWQEEGGVLKCVWIFDGEAVEDNLELQFIREKPGFTVTEYVGGGAGAEKSIEYRFKHSTTLVRVYFGKKVTDAYSIGNGGVAVFEYIDGVEAERSIANFKAYDDDLDIERFTVFSDKSACEGTPRSSASYSVIDGMLVEVRRG
jgi:hypothetical protein